MKGLSQDCNVEQNDFSCSKKIDFPAAALVKGEGGSGNVRRSLTDGSGIWIGRGVLAGATGIGDKRDPLLVT